MTVFGYVGVTVEIAEILMGLVVCLFCLASLIQGRLLAPETEGQGEDEETPLTFREALPTLLWITAILPLVFVLGFSIGLPLYVFAYLKAHGRSWVQSTVMALSVLAIVYLFFVRVLGMPAGVFPAGGL